MSHSLKLPLIEVRKETSDSITMYFDAGNSIKNFYPGQFLTIIIPFENRSVRRSYSICTSPEELPRIGVCVKRVDGGLVSNILNDRARVGETYELLEPYGNFNLNHTASSIPPIVLIGAGSGITPLMSITKTVLKKDIGKIALLYGNRDEESIIFKIELDQLVQQNQGRFILQHHLSRPKTAGAVGGRIDEAVLSSFIETNKIDTKSSVFFLCGPEGLIELSQQFLTKMGVDRSQILKESFYHAPKVEPTNHNISDNNSIEHGENQIVTIRFEGQDHEIEVLDGQPILEAALDAGLDLPYACQMGICGMCRADKIAGEMVIGDQEALSDSEINEGACLTCVGHPVGTGLYISYDR
jgi:ring-1,2-phenylacetyl-CoA epoxidase subunit PaaE